jgi:anti-sigma-K factor RskA
MTDFRDLFGEDLSPEDRVRLERVDRLLRSVPAPPPEVPGSLDRAVNRIGTERRLWTTRRFVAAVALAAALAALFFGVGRWTSGGEPHYRATVRMTPAASNPRASASIKLGEREANGNWKLRLQVDGLPELGGDGYYVLWLAKDGKYAATCGTFKVRGPTTVDMTVSYQLSEYDAWVISEPRENAPWLLSARIRRA